MMKIAKWILVGFFGLIIISAVSVAVQPNNNDCAENEYRGQGDGICHKWSERGVSDSDLKKLKDGESFENIYRETIIFKGSGDIEATAKQPLSGSYEVSWKTYRDCVYYAHLSSGNDLFSADGTFSGTSYIYDLPNGDYYIEVITGPAPSCGWDITFKPIN